MGEQVEEVNGPDREIGLKKQQKQNTEADTSDRCVDTHCQILIPVWRQKQRYYDLVAKGWRFLVLEQLIDGVQLTRNKSEVVQNRGPAWNKRIRQQKHSKREHFGRKPQSFV